jgi:hypothetical protein
MKFLMSKSLKFWVYVEYDDVKTRGSDRPKSDLIAAVLREFEETGDAMRFLNASGRVAWKTTPRMPARLADAEREAGDDLADWP